MNTERILKLAETIERYGDEHFNMSSFCNRGATGRPTFCGTTACVAGWVLYIGREAREIVMLGDDDDAVSQARRWLGIDREQGSALFYPESFWANKDAEGRPYTAARAVTVLRELAETGEVNWRTG